MPGQRSCPRTVFMPIVFVVVIMAGLSLPGPAHAASGGSSWVDSLGDMLDSVGNVLMSPFADNSMDMVAPPMGMGEYREEGEGGDPFWHFLEEAGYRMKEVKAHVSLIPGLDIEFVLVRELSEADRNSLERKLEIDTKRNSGLLPSIKRRIIRTLLEASDFDEMRIEELTISLLPLPSAEFVLAPVEGPLGEEHDLLYRSLQEMQHQTEQLQESIGGRKK